MKKTFKISVLSFFVILLLFILNINIISVRAINVNAELHDETRITSYTNDLPAITILTDGQRGKASYWSSYKGVLVYALNSIVSGTTNYCNLRKVGGFLGIGRTDQARYASKTECGYRE